MCERDIPNNSISDILSIISVLQQNACIDSSLDSCDRPMLGGGPACLVCNTRPVMIYSKGNGSVPWSMPITKDATNTCIGEGTDCSPVFRVEKVDGDCCTFRVLAPNPDETSLYPYVNTNSIFTMNIDCICCIRCLTDTYVECI